MNQDIQRQIEASMTRIAAELRLIGDVAAHLETDAARVGLELRSRVRPDNTSAWTVLPLADFGAPVRTTWTELPPQGASGADEGAAH